MQRQHFVVVTPGTLGNLVPFLRSGSHLQAGGHPVTVTTHADDISHIQASGLQALALDRPEAVATSAFGRTANDGTAPTNVPIKMRRGTFSQGVAQAALPITAFSRSAGVLISHITMFQVTLIVAERLQWLLTVDLTAMFQYFNRLRTQRELPGNSSWLAHIQSMRFILRLWPDWFAAPEQRWLVLCRAAGSILPDQSIVPPLPHQATPLLAQRPISTHHSSLPASDTGLCVCCS